MLILLLTFLSASALVDCIDFAIGKPGRKQVVFEKFDNLCGICNPAIIFNYTGVRIEGTKMLLNSSITVRDDITKDPKLIIRIERCKNKENLDTCEPFHVYRANSYCSTITVFAWDFMKSFEPEWKCPIKKGIYRAKNAEIDVTAFFVFPVETWYWKVHVNILERNTNRILFCIIAEMHMRRI